MSLLTLSSWRVDQAGTEISKTFKTRNFLNGLAFITKITIEAEVLLHHPDIELTYKTVKVKLTTHDASGLTQLDFALAKRIDALG